MEEFRTADFLTVHFFYFSKFFVVFLFQKKIREKNFEKKNQNFFWSSSKLNLDSRNFFQGKNREQKIFSKKKMESRIFFNEKLGGGNLQEKV